MLAVTLFLLFMTALFVFYYVNMRLNRSQFRPTLYCTAQHKVNKIIWYNEPAGCRFAGWMRGFHLATPGMLINNKTGSE